MNSSWGRSIVLCGALASLAFHLERAEARATLEAQIVDVRCSVTTPDGAVAVVPCSADGWAVTIRSGSFAQMVATIDYSYVDDGLNLTAAGTGFQLDSAGFRTLIVDHEAGALYALTSNCVSRYCRSPPGQDYTGESGFPPLFLSANDVADAIDGTLTVTTGASFTYQGIDAWTPNIFITLRESVFSVEAPVAAIPEPGTLTLMSIALVLLAGVIRRSQINVLPLSGATLQPLMRQPSLPCRTSW